MLELCFGNFYCMLYFVLMEIAMTKMAPIIGCEGNLAVTAFEIWVPKLSTVA